MKCFKIKHDRFVSRPNLFSSAWNLSAQCTDYAANVTQDQMELPVICQTHILYMKHEIQNLTERNRSQWNPRCANTACVCTRWILRLFGKYLHHPQQENNAVVDIRFVFWKSIYATVILRHSQLKILSSVCDRSKGTTARIICMSVVLCRRHANNYVQNYITRVWRLILRI